MTSPFALLVLVAGTMQDGPDLSDLLRARLEESGAPPRLVIAGEIIHASVLLPTFYESRGFTAAWVDGHGAGPLMDNLLDAVRRSADHGLRPSDYHLPRLEQRLAEAARQPDARTRLVEIELLATDAFLGYAADLLAGHLDPVTISPTWLIDRPEADLIALLTQALSTGEIHETLEQVAPADPAYRRLKEAFAAYRTIASRGGWPAVPAGPTLRTGDSDPRVAVLRKRLAATDHVGGDLESPVFDETLRLAVEAFQRSHGLEADGLVGPATLRALNVPVGQRLTEIRVNLERWRWLPVHLGERYILVNIAGFRLDVVEAGKTILTMRAVVGRPYRNTPVFMDSMTYLVFSPYWHVPPGIARRDIMPKVQEDPDYLAAQGFRVFSGWDNEVAIDPATIQWARVSRSDPPYRFRQDPGPNNALGRVKFMFPNRFNVYLHDTPARELFEEASRAFSSGCVRIEKPGDLARYLLQGARGWDEASIEAAMNQGREQAVRLARPIPVHLLYWTVWADEGGEIQFRGDVYDRDERVRRALDQPPPVR